jgi:hypothetical protein
MKDADGNYLTEDVDIPTDCIAIISEINVHMPNKYISPTKEHFDYVDMIERTFDGNVIRNYIYIIPRKYCHKMYQTALVLSLRKLSKFYEAYALSFVNGFTVYLSSIPYKPTKQQKGRILKTKLTDDYKEEMKDLREFWIKNGMMHNPNLCVLTEEVKGRENMAYLELPGTDEYIDTYDEEHTLERNTENLMSEGFSYVDVSVEGGV